MEVVSHLWDFTDPIVDFFRSVIPIPDDMMRLSIVLFASFPAAAIYQLFLETAFVRMAYSLLIGLGFVFFCFKWEAIYFIATGLLSYLICAFIPTKQSPRLVLLLSFGVLTYG
jgi:hypothetical protein